MNTQPTSPHRDFATQMENFKREAHFAALCVYADMTVQHAASKSKELLAKLNEAATFWNAHAAASQTAAYICLGRIFDTNSRYNVVALVDSFEANIALFSRESLLTRKSSAFLPHHADGLNEYLNNAHYPTSKDVGYLRRRVETYRRLYERAFKRPRNRYLAHREIHAENEVAQVFEAALNRDMWRTVGFLQALYAALQQQWLNGRRPLISIGMYSITSLYDAIEPPRNTAGQIVSETKKFLASLVQQDRSNAGFVSA